MKNKDGRLFKNTKKRNTHVPGEALKEKSGGLTCSKMGPEKKRGIVLKARSL